MARILDRDFKYRPAAATDVMDTLRRHGFKPTTASERRARQRPKPKATVTTMKRRAA